MPLCEISRLAASPARSWSLLTRRWSSTRPPSRTPCAHRANPSLTSNHASLPPPHLQRPSLTAPPSPPQPSPPPPQVDSWVVVKVGDPQWVFKWRLQAEVQMRSAGKPGLTDEQVADFVSRFMPAYRAYLPVRTGPGCYIGSAAAALLACRGTWPGRC